MVLKRLGWDAGLGGTLLSLGAHGLIITLENFATEHLLTQKHENFATHVPRWRKMSIAASCNAPSTMSSSMPLRTMQQAQWLDPLFISETPEEGSTSYALLDVVKRQVRVSQWARWSFPIGWRCSLGVRDFETPACRSQRNSGQLRNRRCNWRN
jgi:hypothetical protein